MYGIDSYDRDENSDARMFAMTCLLSSTIIYNVMTVIDEKAIEALSFTTHLASMLQSEEHLSNYLPSLLFVIRDFALELPNADSKLYLEKCLKLLEGESAETKQKNDVRLAILNYFRSRDCFTLVRPVNDEEQLRSIDQVAYSELRNEFKVQVDALVKEVLSRASPKVIKGSAIQGRHFCELITQYVSAMNSQAIPNITSTWERVIDKEFRRCVEKAKLHLAPADLLEQLPLSTELLFQAVQRK